jgi:hypothetical protein
VIKRRKNIKLFFEEFLANKMQENYKFLIIFFYKNSSGAKLIISSKYFADFYMKLLSGFFR